MESDSDAEEAPSHLEEGDVPIGDRDLDDDDFDDLEGRNDRDVVVPKAINIALKDVSVSKEGKVIVAGREESGRTIEEDEEGVYLHSKPMYPPTQPILLLRRI